MARRYIVAGLATFLFSVVNGVHPAMAQIAPGVTQSAAHTANITGTVTESNGTPVVGAEVNLNGPALLSTRSDDHGVFSFRSVPWGTYQILVTSTLGTASRNNVVLNGDITVAIQYQPQAGLHTIARVSTTGVGAHINVTSSSITSLSPSEYAFQGNGTWTQLFAQVPGVAVSGYSYGGDNTAATFVGAPQTPVALSVNGALPYETSTTLDGMPLQGTSASETFVAVGGGFDLSNLPLNAFDTADVIRGPGANAPSIVDSVNGSFVLHAPGQVDMNSFEYSVSNDPYGGVISNAKVALHLGRLSATFIYGVNDSPGPLGATNVMPAYFSVPTTINGQTAWGLFPSFNPNAHGIANCFCTVTYSLLYCCVPYSSAWTAHSGAAALSYSITPSIVAEVFYAGATSRQELQGGYMHSEFAPSLAVPSYSGSLPASPPGQANYALLEAGAPELSTDASSLLEEKLVAYMGRGVLRLAALQNNTFNAYDFYSSFANAEYTLWGTADVGASYPGTSVAYNGTSENLTFPNETFNVHYWSNNRDLLGSYAVQISAASSIGISYVTSYYNDPYSTTLFFGNTPIYSANQAPAASETTDETRLHFDTQVSDKFSLGFSWYFAAASYHVPVPSNLNYWTNSVFPYNAPRFGGVWEVNPDIAIRASAGGGYALPILNNLTGFALSCEPSSCSETVANLDLKPEETFGFDVGTDVRFHRDTVLSFDLYHTNLYGQFFQSTTLSSYNGLPLWLYEYGNLGASRYEGINLDVRRDVPSSYYWRGTLGLTRGYVVSLPTGFYNNPSVPCTNCVNQGVVLGPNFNSAVYSATVPYASASAQIGYRWSPGRYFDLSSTYYGSNNIYNTPKAFVELDAHAGYTIVKNVSLLATFRNITGVYDQSVQTYYPGYAVPVISGAPSNLPGAAFELPYGPRSVIVTVNLNY